MAPEQARGRTVDKRADIWAFGVVAWQMLTGRPLFAGETVTDTLAAVLTREIDWSLLPGSTPPTRGPAAALSRRRSEEAPARHRRRQARRSALATPSAIGRRRQPRGAGGCGDWRFGGTRRRCRDRAGSVPAWRQDPRRGKCGSRSQRTTRASRRSRPTGRWQSWRRAVRCGCATSPACRCES